MQSRRITSLTTHGAFWKGWFLSRLGQRTGTSANALYAGWWNVILNWKWPISSFVQVTNREDTLKRILKRCMKNPDGVQFVQLLKKEQSGWTQASYQRGRISISRFITFHIFSSAALDGKSNFERVICFRVR